MGIVYGKANEQKLRHVCM